MGIPNEEMAGIVTESWLEWGLGTENAASSPPEADKLAVYDTVTTDARKSKRKLGKLANRGHHAVCAAYLDQLPEVKPPPGPDVSLGGMGTKAFDPRLHIISSVTHWLVKRQYQTIQTAPFHTYLT